MNWEDIKFFLAVARAGNLSEAALQMEVSASTASRHIERLEHQLQQILFIRRYDGYRLTQAGASVMASGERIEAQVQALKRGLEVETQEPRGVVRLATPELLAHEIILPALPAFRAANPWIMMELVADVRPVSLKKRAADIVIRTVRPTDGEYKMHKIGRLAAALFGSSAYLQLHGEPREPRDLASHALIGWDHELRFLVMSRWLTELAGEHEPWLRTSNFTTQYLACRAGLGLAVLPSLIAKNAGLCRVLPHLPPLQLDLWLLVSIETNQGERVKRVVGFLNDLFSNPALLE